MEDFLRPTRDEQHEFALYVFQIAILAKAEVTVLRSLAEQSGVVIDNAAYEAALGVAVDAEIADMTTRKSEYLDRLAMAIFALEDELAPLEDEDDDPPPTVHGV